MGGVAQSCRDRATRPQLLTCLHGDALQDGVQQRRPGRIEPQPPLDSRTGRSLGEEKLRPCVDQLLRPQPRMGWGVGQEDSRDHLGGVGGAEQADATSDGNRVRDSQRDRRRGKASGRAEDDNQALRENGGGRSGGVGVDRIDHAPDGPSRIGWASRSGRVCESVADRVFQRACSGATTTPPYRRVTYRARWLTPSRNATSGTRTRRLIQRS